MLTSCIDLYLSSEYRELQDKGCAIVAPNGDAARMSKDIKVGFEIGIKHTILDIYL